MEQKHTEGAKYSDIVYALTTIQDNTTTLRFYEEDFMGMIDGECKFDNSLPKSQLGQFHDQANGQLPKA